MEQSRQPLAWYRWPEPQGTSYHEADLNDPQKVRELFDYCQILLATINKEGWRFLVETYGISGLLDINRQSGWFDETDENEAIQELFQYCLIAGYDPEQDRYGEYNPETGVFNPEARDN